MMQILQKLRINLMKSIGLAGWLTIIFVIAKLAGFIGWSWWWVFSPLWISAAIAVVVIFLCGVIAALVD